MRMRMRRRMGLRMGMRMGMRMRRRIERARGETLTYLRTQAPDPWMG